MSLAENSIKQLADRFDLPVFIFWWVWATARIIASGGQPDALLAVRIVGPGFAPAGIQHTAYIEEAYLLC